MRMKTKISITLLSVLWLGVTTQSFAIPVSINAEGVVTDYSYSTAADPFSGSVNIGDAFSSTMIIDPDVALDYDWSADVGRYGWYGDTYQTTASIEGGVVGGPTNTTYISIFNDSTFGDTYRLDSWEIGENDTTLISIYLRDTSGTAFDSDALNTELDISKFDVTRFGVQNFDSSGKQNFLIAGEGTSLIDPPVLVKSVPEPGTVFLLGLGLLGVLLAGQRKVSARLEYAH
jgi:hypothetical protein